MPGSRNLPARASQRRHANQQDDEPPSRTRSGRGPKSAARDTKPDIVSPKANSHQISTTPQTRKTTRQASAVTNYADLEAGNVVYGLWEAPIFHVFGIPREFLDGLKEQKPSKKRRFSERSELPALNTLFTHSDTMSEDDESDESDEPDEPPSPQPAPTRGRGRGGRGSRGGRGRGRGRGSRGGRGGKASAVPRTTSPLRTRPSRNAAPAFPLVEEEEDEASNQDSAADDAKHSLDSEGETMNGLTDDELDAIQAKQNKLGNSGEGKEAADSVVPSKTPPGSPPSALVHAYNDLNAKIPVPTALPKISLSEKPVPRTRTPKEGTSTPVPPAPKLPSISPEEDAISESDLLGPWVEDAPSPVEAECEDRADYLLQKRFKPMVDVQDVIASLTKYAFAQRSTESLYALAENTEKILKAWQDEYLVLDARTAPHAHPPKKPCNGGRIPINPLVYEDMKEADIYGYTYNPKIPEPGFQDPFTQRPGHERSGGRELRQRRANAMLDSAAPSEEEEEDEEGRPAKRQRRATRHFEPSEAGTGSTTPKKHNGWGGARKKGVSKYAKPSEPTASATPEPDGRGRRGRGLLHPRVQEMREESAITSSGDEGSSNGQSFDDEEPPARPAKRGGRGGGRGSRGGRGRGGYKGLTKRVFEEDEPIPSAHAPNGPPPALQSLSQGQNQFTIDTPVGAPVPPPVVGPHSTETVFQATPQPPGYQDISVPPPNAHTPDTYMNTTPIHQYSNPYDDSANNSASSSRKKPRVKSEKRSQSMTIWWAERKARQKEADEKTGTPPKPPTSRSNSGTGRRGGRTSAAGSPDAKSISEPQHHSIPFVYPNPRAPSSAPPAPHEVQAYHSHPPPPPPFSVSSPSSIYSPTTSFPPPPSLVMQPSPLTAIPSSVPPPPSMPPGPGRTLAPAPLPPHVPMMAYPSPYGPRTAPRPKSNVPPPLAPAPNLQNHVSPYPPMSILGAAVGPPVRDMPFKVLVPGIPPDSRRGSR
ncbi:hypothetical protein BU23DRAFT_515364 [Bimuria novae-zelandiae CBS 107.79]|uniref:Uncharacterized protein n=1 Tax=Bimuria novae-zelandiae CBS 107.79 TaxID=1447943 RepID=A0A6A5UTK3_9PLEO|nr:hypothetical protein BU23DRAFT_515364 [Bimuria novae-zelandiae CBS 107.79]